MTTIVNGNFDIVKTLAGNNQEGLVLLGCGGDLQEWVDGVTKILKGEGIANDKFQVNEAFCLETTGGRIDLLLVFDWQTVNVGRLAMWRLQFGDASWLSDYVVNYADHFDLVI